MGKLTDGLKAYSETDMYPMHMPGHKRNLEWNINPYKYDITEIEGFDDLHHPEGILRELIQRVNRMYKARESYVLVNGSTSGIMAAISAAVKPGERILVARNSHKSVYNALYLRRIRAEYIFPETDEAGIAREIDVQKVYDKLEEFSDIKAVVITSPTYEGIISDIRTIANTVHSHGAVLIVDCAHGAHLGIGGVFGHNPIEEGADLVIMSLHKTLPAFTQTAVLCVGSERISTDEVKKYTDIYVSTSPSYLLMASVDKCMDIMEKDGALLHRKHYERMMAFRDKCRRLKHLRLLDSRNYDFEKVVVCTNGSDINGKELMHILRGKYHLEAEMASAEYVIAMTSCMDTDEGIDRLYNAIRETDDLIHHAKAESKEIVTAWPGRVKEPWELEGVPARYVAAVDAAGMVSAGYVYIYPPGVPWILPGEMISQELTDEIEQYRTRGFEIRGITDNGEISVVCD